jgi:hypothetical protein
MSTQNPSDKDGSVQSQLLQLCTVIDDCDPEQGGRVKLRVLGEQDDQGKVPDNKCSWVQCVTNNKAQLRHSGSFPPQYKIGSKVLAINLGQQGLFVLGSVPNGEKDDSSSDIHPAARGKRKKVNNGGTRDGNVARQSTAGSPLSGLHNLLQVGEGKLPSTETAINGFLNNRIKNIPFIGDILQDIVKKAQTESKYNKRPGAKVNEGEFKSFANFAFNQMDMTNPTKEVQRLSQELIPNAVSMIEQLKKTAQSGQNILASNSVGGLGNILGAIQGIASMIKKEQNRNDQQDNQNNLEEELRRIYKELTGKEPLDQFGKETAQYIKWKEAYLRGELISV